MKKIIAFVVSALVLAAALTASAAYFSDIPDKETAVAVEQLRMLGVIDGMGNGKFAPNGTLTRAQFCKMATVALGKAESVSQYKNYTIFPDVRQNHWAVAYINMAVRGEKKFITGYPNGTFAPDTAITYGQAVTILMRLLGYQDSDVGMLWPDGYIAKASEIGLSDGVTAGGYDNISRSQAARLFANMLISENKDGDTYVTSVFGSPVKDVILLSNTARASDGTPDSLLTSSGIYKTAGNKAGAELIGEKGMIILDKNGRALTFIPDKEARSAKITANSMKAGYIEDSKGTKIAVSSDTKTFFLGKELTWNNVFASLRRGTLLTVFYNASGAVDYIFAGGAYGDNAVMVSTNGSLREINAIAGGRNYELYRNGVKASASDLCKYDIAVFDEANNRVEVSSMRLTAAYEDAYPNFTLPERITVLGAELDVLPSAVNNLVGYKAGDVFTLLLTQDGKVADVLSADKIKGNAKGIVKSAGSSNMEIELTNGITVSGNPRIGSSASDYIGHLVSVSSNKSGDIQVGRLTGAMKNYGDWNIEKGLLSLSPVSDSVIVYEFSQGNPLKTVDPDNLSGIIEASKIIYSEKENGLVTMIVLNNVTGDSYTYGRAEYSSMDSMLSVTNSEGTVGPVVARGLFKNGEWIGIVLSADGMNETGTVRLQELSDIKFSLWSGSTVTVQGESYRVADDVQCYNETLSRWITLDAAQRLAESANLYVSNGVVRCISIR